MTATLKKQHGKKTIDAGYTLSIVSCLPPQLSDKIGPHIPSWLTMEAVTYAILAVGASSILINVWLILSKKRMESRIAVKDTILKKLQAYIREMQAQLSREEDTIKSQNELIEEQKKILEKSQVTYELKKTQDAMGRGKKRDPWERIEELKLTDTPELTKLYAERDEILQMIDLTKIKYHTRAIDEKSFSNITEDYQKRLIEIESKIKKFEAEKAVNMPQTEASGNVPTISGMATSQTIIGEAEIKARIQSKVKNLTDSTVLLISSKSENHRIVISGMLDVLVNQRGMGGVFISVSRPHETILATMESAGIPSNDVLFIDCISQMTGKIRDDKSENVVYVENPSSLEEVSMYLEKMLTRVKKPKRFIFLDSLSSLLIYNNDKSVREFTHFLINRIRLENIAGVILSIEKKEVEDLVKTLTPMCDEEMRF